MAELYWFAFFAKDWLSSPARMTMVPEQRGAYIDLLALAWGNGDEPPSLPADDASLAALSGLYRRWKTLGPLVRAQFDEVNGRLYNEKLTNVWHEQQARHEQAVARGRNGGRARADRRKLVSSPTTDQLETEQRRTVDGGVDSGKRIGSGEAVDTSPNGLGLPASAPAGALALNGARAAALIEQWRGSVAQDDSATLRLEGEYFRQLEARADAWARENPDDAGALEREVRREMGLPPHRTLSAFEHRAVREQMLERIRENNGWPDSEAWIAEQGAHHAA